MVGAAKVAMTGVWAGGMSKYVQYNAALLLGVHRDGQRYAMHARLLTSSFISPRFCKLVLVWVNGSLAERMVKAEI